MPLLKNSEFKPASWTPCRWKVLPHFVGVVGTQLDVFGEPRLPVSFNASPKLVCVRLIDKTVNLIHCLQRADLSEVLRGLHRWYDHPTANGATVHSTYVAKQINSP